jgi:iron complex outermembrane receptor protein
LLAAACVQCGAARAAEPGATTEKDFLADVPVVLTASRLGQAPAEAPNAITVIDRELIQATGAREIAELFRLVPGMYVSYVTYIFGLQAIVSYHGLASEFTNRMQVLVDGRAVR